MFLKSLFFALISLQFCLSERIFNCDFETDWCGAEDIDSEFLLSESNTDTPTHGTGPSLGDHTSGNGYFIFAECSWPRVEGDKAGIVVSDLLCSTGLGNVEGYLNRKGSDPSQFRVAKRAQNDAFWEFQDWDETLGIKTTVSKRGQEEWEFFRFDFEAKRDEKFEIVFEFTCNGHLGDIALDDISVNCVDENKADEEHSAHMPARRPAQESIQESEARHCSNEQTEALSCNFDDELECGWTTTGLTRWQGETFTPGTGPTAAQTGSHYLYLESSDSSQGSLESFVLQSGSSICLTFAYHIRAHKKSSLEVTANDEVIWRSSGIWNEKTNKWKNAQMDIFMKQPGRINIKAVAKSVQSDIALDSLKVSGCPCNYDEEKKSVLNCLFEEEKSTCGYTPSSFIKLRKGILINPFGELTSAKNEENGCLSIIYRSNQDKMKLAAYQKTTKKNVLIWETTQNTRGAWVKESFNVGKDGIVFKNEPLDLSDIFAVGFEIKSTSFNFLTCQENHECDFESGYCNLEYSEAKKKERISLDFYGVANKGVHLEYGENLKGVNPWRVGCLKIWNSARGVIFIDSRGRRHTTSASFSRPWQLIQRTVPQGAYHIKAEDYSLISSVALHSGPCLPCCQNDGVGQLWSKCRNGRCVASDDLCDGFDDCGDGSDEANDICDRSSTQCGVSSLTLDEISTSAAKTWEELLNLSGLSGERPRLKLAGGHVGPSGQFPWLALIYIAYQGEEKVCGGGILDNKWIITAAHCVQKYDSIEVVVGEYDRLEENRSEQKFKQDLVLTHEYYSLRSGQTPKNDIALIRLNDDIIFNQNVVPICWESGFNVGFVGDNCAIAGWGHTENGIDNSVMQQFGAMQIIDKSECAARWNGTDIPESTICAGQKYQVSACKGDSGGPLVCKGADERWHLRGIVSFGRGKCSMRNPLPTVFTDIPKFKSWITQSIRDNAVC